MKQISTPILKTMNGTRYTIVTYVVLDEVVIEGLVAAENLIRGVCRGG
jgi:hypothetical protein